MGIRRTELLREIREVKGQPRRPSYWKHIPTKYRKREPSEEEEETAPRGVSAIRTKPDYLEMMRREKSVSVYSSVGGEERRIRIRGKGKDLFNSVRQVFRIPPKRRWTSVYANELREFPERFLDPRARWDREPKVDSP